MLRHSEKVLRRVLIIAAACLLLLVTLAETADAHVKLGFAARKTITPEGEVFNLKLVAGPAVLPSSGGTVEVYGTGYNTKQGIYLAFCVIPGSVRVGHPATYGALPTPCLGGRKSTDGTARRITNTDTGTPTVTISYAPRGSFHTTLNLKPKIAKGVVCGVTVRCAIVTRADHTATGNRLYDQYIPVHFAR